MPVLQFSIAQVNFSDYLHITIAKVSAPNVIVYEEWVATPFAAYNFTCNVPDWDNYLVTCYEAATDTDLGNEQLSFFRNVAYSEWEDEYRFYVVGRGNTGDPADNDTAIVDSYLIGRQVAAVEKRGFGKFDPLTETTYTPFSDTVTLNSDVCASGDTYVLHIRYKNNATPSTPSGLYSGVVNVTAATYTISPSDANKRFRLVGTAPTQVITASLLAAIADGSTFLLDNSVGGTAKQVKLVRQGSDTILYTGMGTANLTEIWLGKGECLLYGKVGSNYEVLTPYTGGKVGEVFASYLSEEVGALPMDGVTLFDGDELPRLWWYIQNRLPNDRYVVDDNVVTGGYTNPTADTKGQFVVHSTLKKFRTPNMRGMTPKGVGNFASPGSGDKPGRFQPWAIGEHDHRIGHEENGRDGGGGRRILGAQPFDNGPKTKKTGGPANLVDNVGFVWHVRV